MHRKNGFGAKKHIYATISLLLVLFIALTSCVTDAGGNGGGAVAVEDDLGRVVSVPDGSLRTAALLGSFADVWTLAGGSLVAAAEDAWERGNMGEDVICLGGAHSPSLELLFSADPTLVLASASTPSHIALGESLSAAGVAVLYFDVDNFEDYLSMLARCTRLTGRTDLYEKHGLLVKETIEKTKADYQNTATDAASRRVLLLRATSGTIKAKGSYGTVLGEMLRDIGCENIADADGTLLDSLSVEAVIREEPYHIFVVPMGNDTAAAEASVRTMLRENAAWASLSAVREGRVHYMDKTLFHTKPNERWGEAYETLYRMLIEK